MTLLRLIVIIITNTFIINLMIKITHRISKGIKLFRCVFFTHKRIIFLLFESYFDGDGAAVEVGLAVQVLDCKQGTLFSNIIYKSPILSFLKSNCSYFTKNRKYLKQCISRGLAGQ